ncbi:MAG TPA: TlyA family RNA methyltransferase [Pseudomonadales bacterium]|nr:TlyA family RNA methyltransferase [Pseudomonadales bacterium]
MQRADLLIVEKGLASSRAQAQRLISSHGVQWQDNHGEWHLLQKASQPLSTRTCLRLCDDSETRYVSRGGLKLAGALSHCELDVNGLTCLDIGQSTGGFTDCLLQAGAAHVVGIDVGHSQLHPSLRDNPRVTSLEKINARALPAELLAHTEKRRGFDLAVMDVSFISQTLILPSLAALLCDGGYLLALVKPQFEAGPEHLNKQGLLKSDRILPEIRQRICTTCEENHLQVLDYFSSQINGGDGNREFFVFCQHKT